MRMTTLFLFALSACSNKTEAPRPTAEVVAPKAPAGGNTMQAQVPVGGDGTVRRLPFRIEKVYEAQKPSDQAPWHEAGGDWSYFDARTPGGAAFTVGVKAKKPTGDIPIGFGNAAIIPADRDAGTKLTAEIARAFDGGAAPAPAGNAPLKPATMRLAILGYDTACSPSGGCGGDGTWVATKWFLSKGAVEVFFNYDLKGKNGEFGEKDAEYRKGLVAAFAALRDGR